MWQTYIRPPSLSEALDVLHEYGERARIIAGGTDVLVELQRHIKLTSTVIDITALPELKYMRVADGMLCLGALTTHNDVIMSAECREHAFVLAQACGEVGAPQIRTRATIAGNIVTASPANDTIAPLLALGAVVVLTSKSAERVVALSDFYLGVRRTVCLPGEIVREIRVPLLSAQQRSLFLKLGLRRAQAISVINVAFVLTFADELITDAQITLGCLAPTVVHASSAEKYLKGKPLNESVWQEAGRLARVDVRPIGDIRASANYRLATVESLVAHGLQRIASGTEQEGWLAQPVSLETEVIQPPRADPLFKRTDLMNIVSTTINGRAYRLAGVEQKTLLNALREDAGLTGTKEGCAEGECGACTVWLNGQAVMSCLVPAAQAEGADDYNY